MRILLPMAQFCAHFRLWRPVSTISQAHSTPCRLIPQCSRNWLSREPP